MIKSAQDVTEEQGMGFAVPAQLEEMKWFHIYTTT